MSWMAFSFVTFLSQRKVRQQLLSERKSKLILISSIPKNSQLTGHMSSPRQLKNNKPEAGSFHDDASCIHSKSPSSCSFRKCNCNLLNFVRVYIAYSLEFNI